MNQEIKTILKELKKVVENRHANDYIELFRKKESNIIDFFAKSNQISSEIYLHDPVNYLEKLKFAALFSNVISLFTLHSQISGTNYKIQFPTNPEITLTAPNSIEWSIRKKSNAVNAGYLYWKTSNLRKAFKDIEPLLNKSRAIVRPMRIVSSPSLNPSADREIHYVNPNDQEGKWTVLDGMPHNSIPIYYSDKRIMKVGKKLFELTLPYFENISLSNFEKILTEEVDLIDGFRANLLKVIKEGKAQNQKIEEIKNDLLSPEIAKINRKFTVLQSTHKIIIRGTLGFYSLSLISLTWFEYINELAGLIAGGTGIVPMLLADKVFQERMDELRDNPYFLLWKLQKN
jgi:hypothetical protein